jgi:hypothetical protein
MHFIEQVFGVSPDGGAGLTEIAFILAVVTALVVTGLRVARARWR